MKVLVEPRLYFMILLAGVLSMIDGATGDDKSDVPIGEIKQVSKKPTIMVLGSWHFTSSGLDGINERTDDVRAPKRQREIKQVIEKLKEFKPTKVAVETDPSRDAEINAGYQGYLNGTYELGPYEGEQIGYRLAKEMGHSKVYGVDYWPKRDPIFESIRGHLINRSEFAKAHNQEHLFGDHPIGPGKITRDKEGRIWIEPEEYEPILDKYIRINQPGKSRASQRAYLHDARIGLDDKYPGADWLAHVWYARNLKIFVNLTRITESADDRIFLIIGGGHLFLVRQFLEDSGDYIIESPLKYLDTSEGETP